MIILIFSPYKRTIFVLLTLLFVGLGCLLLNTQAASAQQVTSSDADDEKENVQNSTSVESILRKAVNTKNTPAAVSVEQRGNEIILRAK